MPSICLVGFALFLGPVVSTAKAEEVGRSDIVITSGSGGFTTTLKLALSKPITATQRRQVIKDLKSGAADGQVSPMAMIRIDCNQTFARTTNEGTWETDYKCFPTYATLPWGFRISKSVRGIIVGLVKEHGLKWWRNNVSQPKNAPDPGGQSGKPPSRPILGVPAIP